MSTTYVESSRTESKIAKFEEKTPYLTPFLSYLLLLLFVIYNTDFWW